MLEGREAEEWRGRGTSKSPFHGADAFFDFFLALIVVQFLVVEVLVGPGVRADGMSGRINLFEDFRIIGCVLADREEDARGAFLGQRLQHRWGVLRPGPVVEGQHHLMIPEEIEILEMLEAEPRAASCVDFDRTRDTKSVRIVAGSACGLHLCGGAGRRGGYRLRRLCLWG